MESIKSFESINSKNNNNDNKENKFSKIKYIQNIEEENSQDVKKNMQIDQQIKIEFLKKKKNRYVSIDKNDFSKIRSDLLPDCNYQGYNIENENKKIYENILLSLENRDSKKKINRDEIIDDLRVNLLKHNLEKNNIDDSNFNKGIENLISKEILFYQFSRLFTSNEDKIIKSFIIKKINELIKEDNLFENLLLLSKIQIFKDSSVNKKKLKNDYLTKLKEMISKDRFKHLKLSNCNSLF